MLLSLRVPLPRAHCHERAQYDSSAEGEGTTVEQSLEEGEETTPAKPRLEPEDLIPDSRLQDSEQDAFGHREIAGRVADIALYGETPLNIALFGAWGSGKSSFFHMLQDALKENAPEVRAVRYDAWKFGGASLKRNFVSHAASELGLDPDSAEGRPYHRGLYESIRTVDFNLVQFFKKHLRALTLALSLALVVSTLLIVGAAAIWSMESDLAFGSRFAHLAPGVYKYLGTGLFAVGALINVLATVNIEQTSPSEEERFADLFRDLVRDATTATNNKKRKKGNDEATTGSRIVFFIDELDRCVKEDVIATLTSLRTFLDQEHCVFVVAADREVLEEALTAVEQSTPIREHEPYYNSASAFLDKIFQHQVSLPPLRTGRLTRFAKDLVKERGGLWGALRTAEDRERRLNTVIYALIPPHVRSPRRVKVLLNNYATNVRVAESRGKDWLTRATEIAKLTVLQTEFPHLAADLLFEPRLPRLLLHPPEQPTDRQKLLLARHRLFDPTPPEDSEAEGDADEVEVPADDPAMLLVDGGEASHDIETSRIDAQIKALRERQRADLHRYLTSREAAGIPDPGRDLMYLEDAGESVGLHDPDLSQLLEDYASDDPTQVRGEVQKRPPKVRIAAARMLGVMSERDFGPERTNAVTALAQAAEGLAPIDFDGELGDLIEHVTAYQVEDGLDAKQLAGLFTLAVGARDVGAALRSTLLADQRLLTDTTTLGDVASLLPHLSATEAKNVASAICGLHHQAPNTLLGIIGSASGETLAATLTSGQKNLIDAINSAEKIETEAEAEPVEGEPTATGRLVIDLLDALQPRINVITNEAVNLLAGFVANPETELYARTLERAAMLVAEIPAPADANQVPLAALSAAPIDDWADWGRLLKSSKDSAARQPNALTHILGCFAADPATALDDAIETVPRVLSAGQITEPPDGIAASIGTGLALLNYWENDEALAIWSKALTLAHTLSEALPDLAGDISGAISADIERVGTVGWDTTTPPRIEAAGLAAGDGGLTAAATVLEGTGATPTPTPDLPVAVTTARMRVAGAAATAGIPVTSVPIADVLTVAAGGTTEVNQAVAAWIDTGPPLEELIGVLDVTKARPSLTGALSRWSAANSPADAENAFLHVLDKDLETVWLGPLASNPGSRTAILDQIAERLKAATAHPERLRLVEAVQQVRPIDSKGIKQAAEMTLGLLLRDKSKVTVEEAAVLAPLLTGNYGLKKRINDALADGFGGGRIQKVPRARFEGAGFTIPKPKGWRAKVAAAIKGE